MRGAAMNELRAWAAEWGDIASVAGFFLAIVGFGITIFGVWRSKSAAEQARPAALAARESIARYDAIAELAATMAIMEESSGFSVTACGYSCPIAIQRFDGASW